MCNGFFHINTNFTKFNAYFLNNRSENGTSQNIYFDSICDAHRFCTTKRPADSASLPTTTAGLPTTSAGLPTTPAGLPTTAGLPTPAGGELGARRCQREDFTQNAF